jgi:hypothetical protein
MVAKLVPMWATSQTVEGGGATAVATLWLLAARCFWLSWAHEVGDVTHTMWVTHTVYSIDGACKHSGAVLRNCAEKLRSLLSLTQ